MWLISIFRALLYLARLSVIDKVRIQYSSCNQIPIWYWLKHKILSSINQLQSSLVPYKPFSSDFLNCPVIGQKISCRQQISCGQTGRLNGVRCTEHTATWESRALRNSLQLSKSEIKSNLKLVMYTLTQTWHAGISSGI